MAQKPQQPSKRETRAARRAAEDAQTQARAQQAAKERKQQTIIGVIVIAVVLVLLAVAGVAVYRSTHPQTSGATSSTSTLNADDMTTEQAHEYLKTLDSRPTHADDEGGILISKDGYDKPISDVPTVAIYMDFICPGCGSVHQQLDEGLTKLVDAGQINLDLHFMSFMDRLSTDDYSSRAANAVLYVSDHDSDPSHLLKAVENLFAADFQPKEGSGYVATDDAKIKEQLVAAGVPEDVASKAATRSYDDWLQAVFAYTPHQENLQNSEGSMSTPTITINGQLWDMNSGATTGTMFDKLLAAIGLKADQVGVAGDLPSIGATGKPITS